MPITDPKRITLLGSRVMVELIPQSGRSKTGLLIIPNESRKRSVQGTVLAVGPEQFNVNVGDIIIFSQYSGVPLRESGRRENIIILDDSEIIMVGVNDTKTDLITVLLKYDTALFQELLDINDGLLQHVYFNPASQIVYVKVLRPRAKPERVS